MRRTLLAAGAAFVLVVFGMSAAVAAEDRSRGAAPCPASANPGGMGAGMVSSEFAYLTRMIPHHEEAVAAARALVAGTSRPELRRFGQDVVATQTEEIERMRGWLARWYAGRDTDADHRPMMRDLTGLRGAALDRAFLEDMVPHHLMAVMMSRRLVSRDLVVHESVRPFASTIVRVQTTEIDQMRQWLAQWFGVSAGGMGMGMGGRMRSGR